MPPSRKLLFTGLLLALAILACTLPGSVPPTPIPTETTLATQAPPAQTEQPTESVAPKSMGVLPHAVYYLSNIGEGAVQVWRLEADGVTQTQITNESTDILNYAVSPVDGSVAYVIANQLYWVDADGANRKLLVDGGPQEENDEFFYRRKLSSPLFSPDGDTLAFAQDGINLFTFATGEVRKLISNQVIQTEEGPSIPSEIYSPEMWASAPNQMLVNVSFYEGGTLAILDLDSAAVTRLGEGIVCCQPAWSNDGNNLYVGSPYLGMLASGLWRYDAASGVETVLIPTTSEDETLNFVGWPVQLPGGELQYFFNNLPAIPTGEVPLTLVRSGADGITDRVQVRPDLLLIGEALWTADGSLALVVQIPPGEPVSPQAGPVVLITLDDSPIRPLVANAYDLSWGP